LTENICGKSEAQLIGNTLTAALSTHWIYHFYKGFRQSVSNNETLKFSYTDKIEDGDIHYYIIASKLENNLLVTIKPKHDESMQKARLATKNKQELLERIGRTFAHEIRNPLSGMSLAVERLEEELPEAGDRYIKILETNIDRISIILKEFLFSFRNQTLSLNKCSLKEIINHTLETAGENIRLRNVKVSTDVSGSERMLALDKNKMEIALFNIITNAMEAMEPNKGHLQIKSNWTKNSCCLTIQDNGSGIPQENLTQIFDPFFSLKKNRKGLGLSLVERILTAHEASFEVLSEEGKGTNFTIFFFK